MIIKFIIDKNDYWNFNKYAILHVKYIRNTYLVIVLLSILLVTIFLKNQNGIDFSIPVSIFSAVLGLFASYLISMVFIKWQIKRMVSNNDGCLCEHIIEISKECLIEKTHVNEGKYNWIGIIDICQNKNYIFIFINSNMAHIIPKRSFNSEYEANEFFNRLVDYWKNAKFAL